MPAVRDRGRRHLEPRPAALHRRTSSSATRASTPRCPDLPDTGTAERDHRRPGPQRRHAPTTGRPSRAVVRRRTGRPRPSPSRPARAPTSPSPRTPSARLRLRNPKLWWPNGYGDPAPARPDARRLGRRRRRATGAPPASASASSATSTRCRCRSAAAATRTPSRSTLRPAARPVRPRPVPDQRATGWGISLWTLSVSDSARPATDLALHATATASSVDERRPRPGNVDDGDRRPAGPRRSRTTSGSRSTSALPSSFDRVDLVWEQAYAQTYRRPGLRRRRHDWTRRRRRSTTPRCRCPFNSGDASLQVEDFAARDRPLRPHQTAACGQHQLGQLPVVPRRASTAPSRAPTSPCARTATASTEESDHPAAHRHRRRPAEPAGRPQYEDNQWIQVDLGAARQFDRVAIVWEAAYPKTYVIQVSDDGRARGPT